MKLWWFAAPALTVAVGMAASTAWSQRARPTVQVAPGEIHETLLARAEVVAVDGVAEVRPRADGRVLRVLVREGDRVRAGQLLAEIDAAPYEAEVRRREAEQSALSANASSLAAPARPDERDAADAEAAALREEARLARLQADRTERLHRVGAATEAELQASRATAESAAQRARMAEARTRIARRGGRPEDVRAAQARVHAAEAAVVLARRDLDRTRLEAPIDGVVLARRVDPGDTVSAAMNAEAAFEVADTSRVEIRAEVEDLDAPRVAPGMPVSLRLASSDVPAGDGVLARVSPRLERRRVGAEDVRVRADSLVRVAWITPSRGSGWVLGQRLDAMIRLAPRQAQAVLPRRAVRVADGRALVETPALAGFASQPRAVRLGAVDDARVEVLGLAAGTVVVLHETP
ncbi:MAG: HlyD family efflux transporter periplasmic adaptor subunit [Polyangiales bacterium]